MSGETTGASSDCPHPARALLDFHVNGSLEGEEAMMVAAHVGECAACRREARELEVLSASIEAQGIPRDRPGRIWGWIGTIAATLVIVIGVARVAWRAPAGMPFHAGATEVFLDLGVGGMRDAVAEPPLLVLTPPVETVRITLTPPVVPGTDLRIGLRGPADSEVLAEGPLPPRDAMGRVVLVVPVWRLPESGLHEVVLRATAEDGALRRLAYSFRVEHSVR